MATTGKEQIPKPPGDAYLCVERTSRGWLTFPREEGETKLGRKRL